MNYLKHNASEWPVIGEYDVAVLGAGPAGCGAAISAARMGMKTIIIDKYGFPGGAGTTCCVPYYMGFGCEGKQMVGGIADEVVRELDRMGQASFHECKTVPENKPLADRELTTHVLSTTESIRICLNRMLEKENITRLFYTTVIGAVEVNGIIAAAGVACAEGLRLVKAKNFIDCTGDAHFVYLAGGEVKECSIEESMHKSIFFEVAGVVPYCPDENKRLYLQLREDNKVCLDYIDHFSSLIKIEPGVVQICLTKAVGNSVNSQELTRMDMEMRAQIPDIIEFLRKEMPGFANCFLIHSAVNIGVRIGRRIVGLETLTKEMIDENVKIDEPIVLIHRSYGAHYIKRNFIPPWAVKQPGVSAVPYKTIIPKGFGNVLAAGRSISADPRIADTFRLMSRCMAIGQAAGTAAAISIKENTAVPDVPYEKVRQSLLEQNAILDI